MRRKGRRKKPMSLFKAGAIGIVLITVFTYLAFTKFAIPFAPKYKIQAIFSSANGLQPNSFVRIAGVDVGKVDSVQPAPGCEHGSTSCQAAEVTMEIQKVGLPIHEDATFNIRPRIFLEGNFFVDLHPGTPSAPIAPSGHTFPIQQGTEPVQLDQILSALPRDTRRNLQIVVQQYGFAVATGGPSVNQSIQYWLPAYKYSSIVSNDLLGEQPHDLSNGLYRGGDVAGAFDAHPPNLKSLITDFNTTAGAFARENVALQQSVAELPVTLATAVPAFNALNRAFPPLRELARTLIPGVQSTGPMVDASLPFITQLRYLVQPAELQGLTHDLSGTIPDLTRLTRATIPLMTQQVRPASSCVTNVIHPWTESTVPDSNFNASNGFPTRPVYVEALDFLPGLAGESRVFDANGPIVRVGLSGGTLTYSLSPHLLGQTFTPLAGAQPAAPPNHERPPLNETTPCETQPQVGSLAAPAVQLNPIATNNGTILTGLLSGVTSTLGNLVGGLGLAHDHPTAIKNNAQKQAANSKIATTSSSTTSAAHAPLSTGAGSSKLAPQTTTSTTSSTP